MQLSRSGALAKYGVRLLGSDIDAIDRAEDRELFRDTMKAIATYTSLTGIYEKSRHEDVLSIVSGISQPKGDVHIHFCEPVSQEEIAQCASYNKNERFSALAHLMDKRIHNGYKLHPTNYIAADLLNSSARFEEHYSTEQMEKFIDYVERA
ncbi:MAG: hypothetical protein IIY91_10335, partial [Selenomonas sp.]|nr:hypothetical protein [Selenomonas sp.]